MALANILVASKRDFETRNRKKFCSRIATGDYDAIIIGHSQFEKIPVSYQRWEHLLQEQIFEIEQGIEELESEGAERFSVKQLERTKRSLEARLEKLQSTKKHTWVLLELHCLMIKNIEIRLQRFFKKVSHVILLLYVNFR